MPKTIVVKVGTSTLTDPSGRLDQAFLEELAGQLCDLMDEGCRVVLVTSGAVRAGVEALGWTQRPRTVPLKQAAAAVGQGRLMALYGAVFARRQKVVGQVLLTRQLAQDRQSYVNAQNTLSAMLRHSVLPIINENDTVATEELQFGDNDTMGALVAALVGADLLILLTDVEGLWDAEKRIIPRVSQITPELRALAGGAGKHGSGGMATKLAAADIAGAAGVRTVIARGRRPGVITEVARGAELGTTFFPPARRLRGIKHWLAYGTRPTATLTVNQRARRAVVEENKSLLPAGVIAVTGAFTPGETVSLCDDTGEEFARGLVTCDSREAELLKGVHTAQIEDLLGRPGVVELVHRDNMVVLVDSPEPDVADSNGHE